jgi:hypothetical protein
VARHNVRKVANGQKWTRWYGILKEAEVEDGKTFTTKQHSKRKLSNNDSTRNVLLLAATEHWYELREYDA